MDYERGIDIIVDPVHTSLGGPGGNGPQDPNGPQQGDPPMIGRRDGLLLRFRLVYRGPGSDGEPQDVELPADADLRFFIVTPEGAPLLLLQRNNGIVEMPEDPTTTPPTPRQYQVNVAQDAVPASFPGSLVYLGLKLILSADPQPGADIHRMLVSQALEVRPVA